MAWQPGHRPTQSSISSLAYPLPPALTLRLQSSFWLSGLGDAFQYKRAYESIQNNPHIRASLTKCSLLQLFILVCVLVADYLILPTWTRGSDAPGTGVGRNRVDPETAKFYFQLLWLYPLIGFSFLLSGSFFANVASRAGPEGIPEPARRGSSGATNQSSLLARSLIIGVYLLISAALSRIPFLGRPLSFLYISIVSAYYCFEYRFIASMGLVTLRSRVAYLEERWVYFLGFGIPLTILSSSLFSAAALNLAIWSLLFPFFLLMAAHSDPLPYDAAKPAKSHDLPGQEVSKGTTKFASVNLNPEAKLPDWWPARLPVLYLAVFLDDLVSGFIGSFMRTSSKGPKKSAEGYSGGGQAGYGGYPSAPSSAYNQRRDAYNLNRPNPAAAALQTGFGNVTSAPQNTYGSTGFARQADTYFGNPAPPPARKADTFGVGKAAGVAVRRETANGDASTGGLQARRRQGGSS